MFLVETWEHEAKHITNIDGYIIKSLWPRIRSKVGQTPFVCVYHEVLENCIRVC